MPPLLSSLSFSSSLVVPFPVPVKPRALAAPRVHRLAVRADFSAVTLPVLSFSGDKTDDVPTLVLRSARPETARAVVHRALVHDLQGRRRGTASTLTRGEVRGGGRKPYPQKKTGKARRGSTRTPLRPGGGVIFGPRPKDWSTKINRKEKRLALSTALASAVAAGDSIVVEDFASFFEGRPKTRDFIEALRRWGLDPREKATFLVMDLPENLDRSCRNIGTIKMLTPRTLNLFDILDAKKLVLTRSAVTYLNLAYGKDRDADFEDEEDYAEEEAEGDEGEGDSSEDAE